MEKLERPIAEKTKSEIEKRLEGMGDYVKMSYLQRALKSGLDFDTRKFVLLRLAGIFEAKKMYLESARLVKSAGEINTTFKNKIKDYMKSIELYIKGGNYQDADIVFSQALALGSDREKKELKNKFKDTYMMQAKIYFNTGKRSQAKITYEKILTLDLSPSEKKEVQEELLEIYNKLGNVREYYSLKKWM